MNNSTKNNNSAKSNNSTKNNNSAKSDNSTKNNNSVKNNNSKQKQKSNSNSKNVNDPKLKNKTGNNMKIYSQNFNKLAASAAEDYDFKNGKIKKGSKYETEAEYQNSFSDILNFEKKIKKKDDINLVIFHGENNDGVVSAYYAWKYLVFERNKNVEFITGKPSHSEKNINKRLNYDKFKNKNVLILDLSYNPATFNEIAKNAKELIVIDDHQGITKEDKNIFIGGDHAAVAYTFKFFYPNEKIPKIVQYVDDSDRKLFLPFLDFTNLFTTSLGLRFSHKKNVEINNKFFEDLHVFFKNDNVNYWIFIGKYFDEVIENVKNQIAINAVRKDFQGYKVGVLNFNSPLFTKQVGRQIITNFRNRGEHIDFAVLWGYEYINNAYNVQMIDDHNQTEIKLNKIAYELGKKGGHFKGGGGTPNGHVGHFYWPGDIFDLFKNKYI